MRIFRKVGHVCTFTLISLPIDFPLNRKNQFGGRGEGRGERGELWLHKISYPWFAYSQIKNYSFGIKIDKGERPLIQDKPSIRGTVEIFSSNLLSLTVEILKFLFVLTSNMIVQISIELQLTSMGVKYQYLCICPQTIFQSKTVSHYTSQRFIRLKFASLWDVNKEKTRQCPSFFNFTKIKD